MTNLFVVASALLLIGVSSALEFKDCGNFCDFNKFYFSSIEFFFTLTNQCQSMGKQNWIKSSCHIVHQVKQYFKEECHGKSPTYPKKS